MNIDELMASARDTLTVRRVYGEPYEKDGVTVITAASVRGGGGGGGGKDDGGQEGSGAGFGMTARPAGVYVISGGEVRWIPALDVNRLAVSGAAVVVVFLLARVRLAKRAAQRARRRERRNA